MWCFSLTITPLSTEIVCKDAGTATRVHRASFSPLVFSLSRAEGARCWLNIRHFTFLYQITTYTRPWHILSLYVHFWNSVRKYTWLKFSLLATVSYWKSLLNILNCLHWNLQSFFFFFFSISHSLVVSQACSVITFRGLKSYQLCLTKFGGYWISWCYSCKII